MDCIFCQIRDQKAPCQKVYEDDNFFAILDIRPISLGHVLLITKKHFKNMLEIDDDIAAQMYPVIKKIGAALKTAIKCQGFNIIHNVGEGGGQEIFHSHIHIIPRFKNDGIDFTHKHKEYDNPNDLCNCAKRISEVLNR